MFPSELPNSNESIHRIRWWHILIGVILAAAYLVLLVSTAEDIGYAKDEGYYFSAARSNFSWFKELKDDILKGRPIDAFSDSAIRRHWDNNHEHPGLAKVWMGLSKAIFHDTLGWFKEGTSFRMATMTMAAGAVFLTYLIAFEFAGLYTAIFAVFLLIFMPRFFFHSHLNTFDVPNVFFWTLTVYIFWKAIKYPRLMGLFGIMWGLSMAMRNSGVFIAPVVFLLWIASPMATDFWRALKNIRNAATFGKFRYAMAMTWAILLGFSAFLQASKEYRASAWGFIAMEVVAIGIPLFVAMVHTFKKLRQNPKGAYKLWDSILLQSMAVAMIWLTIEFGDRDAPFNALLLNIWFFLAGYVLWFYSHRAEDMPLWARPIVAPAVLGPITFFIVWPWLYHHTWERLAEFLARHLNPPAWQTIYFGKMITNPPPYPSSYPFVMWAFTIPLPVLILFVAGLAYGIYVWITARREYKDAPMPVVNSESKLRLWQSSMHGRYYFLFVNVLIPPLVIALPSTPIYGGTKHFMHALPFFVIIAASVFVWAVHTLLAKFRPMIQHVVLAILAMVVLVPSIIGLVLSHPYELGYYNSVMGGPIAAPEVGMQQSFWAYQTRNILPWVNENTPPNGSLAFNNLPWECWDMYRRDGAIRKDIRLAPNTDSAHFYITNLWQMYLDTMFDVEASYNADGIVAADCLLGLPMVTVHQNMNRMKRLVKTPWD